MKKSTNKKILKRFKFPIDLIEFPIKYSKEVKIKKDDKEDKTLEVYLEGRYGPYHIETPRKYKLMDIRTFLATLYFADFNKERIFKEKFINWLDLLEVPDTGFYRKSIIEGLDYLMKTIFYTPYIYDTEKQLRDFTPKLNDKGEIDWKNLPSFSVWGILDSYHHLREEKKRKSEIKVIIGTDFYERIFKDKYFTLIDFKKVLPLRDVALNLYLFVRRQDPKYIENFPNDFELLKAHIGITDTKKIRAKETFDKAWDGIKKQELLENYCYELSEDKKYIWFYIQKKIEE